MDYPKTLDYLYSQLPMFQRVGAIAYKADLNNTIAICNLLDNPQKKFKSIHVAGTNGKGSTSHFIASILQSAGYKTGLYTSPHLKDFRERIKINGQLIPEEFIVNFVSEHQKSFDEIKPSFFEMTVGLAFDYFASEQVDFVVIETGLGGRLDSTNIITPILSVITNISLDHVALLGDTIEKIATEKAGIIKYTIPIIIGEVSNTTKDVFLNKAKSENAPIYFAEDKWQVKNLKYLNKNQLLLSMDIFYENHLKYGSLTTELLGLYQQKNIITVLATIQQLIGSGITISENDIYGGIKNVIKNTGLLGRWQILSKTPLTIADTGHNEAGITEVVKQIQNTPHNHLHFVLGVVNDKDISNILKLLPPKATYYFCKANIPRALAAEELQKLASKQNLVGKTYVSVADALNSAKSAANKDDLIFIGGSTFTVAEAI
jgi:dihydrofolate synthase / folylpolyglutamate synthase